MKTTETTMTVIRDDEEIEITLTGEITPGDKGCWTQSNGDPGWPPSGDEIDGLKARTKNGKEIELTEGEQDAAFEALVEAAASDWDDELASRASARREDESNFN